MKLLLVMSKIGFYRQYVSSKVFFKRLQNFFICRANNYLRSIFKRFSCFLKEKTSITINISSYINKFLLHCYIIPTEKSLSQEVIDPDNPTEPTATDFETVVTALQNSDAEFIGEVVEGQNRFGTGPVRDSYFCMASTKMIPRIQAMSGFISKAQYPSQMNILSSEWGSVNNVRFVLSSRGSVSSNASLLGADVYNMFVTGQEAYTSVQLDGESAKFIYHPPGWGDDPAELRQTAAYRFAHARAVTNDAWVLNLRGTL